MDLRIGTGFDVHRLVEGKKLILGGVAIDYDKGLEGHSDADVLVHAIIDALLGAANLGDIGSNFPDNDQQYKDADSLLLLQEVISLLNQHNWQIVNIDTTVIAQEPKLLPYRKKIIEKLANTCNLEPSCISVKATTTEGLGLTGRKEGIAAQAVVLINRDKQD